MKSTYERSLFLSDIHIPFQDKKCLAVVKSFIQWYKPQIIFLIGDILDFYAISKFDKNPNRLLKIQDELDETQDFLASLRENSPRSRIVYLEGNHCYRLTKYLWQHPEIANLKVLTMERLLDLERLNIEFVRQKDIYTFHSYLIEHGDIVRKHSGYTARGQMEKRGVSGISGHSHRLGTHYLTNFGGDYQWVENGCLCDRNPEYIVGKPNWQNGFSIGYFKSHKDRFTIEQIIIVNGKAAFAGREFE